MAKSRKQKSVRKSRRPARTRRNNEGQFGSSRRGESQTGMMGS